MKYLILMLIAASIVACQDGEFSVTLDNSSATAPNEVSWLNYHRDRTTTQGSLFELNGSGLTSNDYLLINGSKVLPSDSRKDSLRFLIPETLGLGSHPVTFVSAGSKFYNPEAYVKDDNQLLDFSLNIVAYDELPRVEGISSLGAPSGEDVDIDGTNLSEDIKLFFGNKELSYLLLSDHRIRFTVPSSIKKVEQLRLSSGQEVIYQQRFLITEQILMFSSLQPDAVCTGVDYYSLAGKLLKGLKDCNAAENTEICSEDGQVSCLTSVRFKASDSESFDASDITIGTTIAGTIGTAVLEAHTDCSAANVVGCVTTNLFKPMNLTDAGTSGALNTANFDVNSRTGAEYEFWDAQGRRHTMQGDSDLTASNLLSGIEIHGVTGTASEESHLDCASASQAGCVATSTYRTMDLSAASGLTDLNAATFNTLATQVGTFEYWDSSGQRHISQGDSDIVATNIVGGVNIFGVAGTALGGPLPDPWDIRYGVTVGSATGRLKPNCRNTASLIDHDNQLGEAIAGLDFYDTIDDWNNGGSFPAQSPWDSTNDDEFFCSPDGGLVSNPNWEKVDTTPATSGANSVYLDRISNTMWTRGSSVGNFAWDDANGGVGTGAIEYCAALSHGGIEAWRLPTSKELLTGYINGIYGLDVAISVTNSLGDLTPKFWSATTFSGTLTEAWKLNVSDEGSRHSLKSEANPVLCVSAVE